MILIITKSSRFYKRFRSDLWGYAKFCNLKYLRLNKRVSKLLFKEYLIYKEDSDARRRSMNSPFIFRIDIIKPKVFKRFLPKRFLSLRLVKYFYLTLRYRQFYTIARKAHKKDGFFEHFYCLGLEGRLITFLYRSCFVTNMFESLNLIRGCFIALNRKVISYVNQTVLLFEILSFHPSIKSKIYVELLLRFFFLIILCLVYLVIFIFLFDFYLLICFNYLY